VAGYKSAVVTQIDNLIDKQKLPANEFNKQAIDEMLDRKTRMSLIEP